MSAADPLNAGLLDGELTSTLVADTPLAENVAQDTPIPAQRNVLRVNNAPDTILSIFPTARQDNTRSVPQPLTTPVDLLTLFGAIEGTITTAGNRATVDLLSPIGEIEGTISALGSGLMIIDVQTQLLGPISGFAVMGEEKIGVYLLQTPLGPVVGDLTPQGQDLSVNLWSFFGWIRGTVGLRDRQLVANLTTPFGSLSSPAPLQTPLLPQGTVPVLPVP